MHRHSRRSYGSTVMYMSNHFLLLAHSAFFFRCSRDLRDLHSFPTRRSSDLLAVHLPIALLVLVPVMELAGRSRYFPYLLPSDRKSTRLNSSHGYISYAVFCLKKKTTQHTSNSRCPQGRVSRSTYRLDSSTGP